MMRPVEYLLIISLIIAIICAISGLVLAKTDKYKVKYQKEAKILGISSCVFAVVALLSLYMK